jgi:hypothetical protein
MVKDEWIATLFTRSLGKSSSRAMNLFCGWIASWQVSLLLYTASSYTKHAKDKHTFNIFLPQCLTFCLRPSFYALVSHTHLYYLMAGISTRN